MSRHFPPKKVILVIICIVPNVHFKMAVVLQPVWVLIKVTDVAREWWRDVISICWPSPGRGRWPLIPTRGDAPPGGLLSRAVTLLSVLVRFCACLHTELPGWGVVYVHVVHANSFQPNPAWERSIKGWQGIQRCRIRDKRDQILLAITANISLA